MHIPSTQLLQKNNMQLQNQPGSLPVCPLPRIIGKMTLVSIESCGSTLSRLHIFILQRITECDGPLST
jgi:hypothetical protein